MLDHLFPKPSRLSKLVQNHFTITPQAKTPQQLSQEAWLIPGYIPFARWMCLPAAFLVQFCRQFVFCWSIFNHPIDQLIQGSRSSFHANLAPLTFYIAITVQGISAAWMGPWLERHGPKRSTLLGGFLFGVGSAITAVALSLRQIWLVYLGYGVIVGSSIGICFIAPVSTLQKWFIDQPGLASGVAVWGVGVGSIVNVKLGVYLLHTVGLQSTFLVVGGTYFILISLSGLVLRTPPPDYVPESRQETMIDTPDQTPVYVEIKREWTLIEALSSSDFWLIYLTLTANVLFGLVTMSRFSNIITDVFSHTPDHAATVMAFYGVLDLVARIIIPVASEYTGKKVVYVTSLTLQLLVLASFYFILTAPSYPLFILSMCTISVCYGGGMGTISAFLTEKFGVANVGPLFGVIVTACSLVGIVGGILSTVIFNLHEESIQSNMTLSNSSTVSVSTPYIVNAWWMLVVVLGGWVASIYIKPQECSSFSSTSSSLCQGEKSPHNVINLQNP